MTNTQILITILIAAAMTVTTRALAFLAFRKGHTPKFVTWLGAQLPAAVMAMLLVYCLKDLDLTASPFGLPGLIAVAMTAAVHVWKKQMILSISAGTLTYMVLIRVMA